MLLHAEDEAAQKDMVKAYRLTMISLSHEALKLEAALLNGDKAKAKEALTKLGQIQKEGHNKFREKRRRGRGRRGG